MSEEAWSNEKLTTKSKVMCSSIKDLKGMRKYVYGACALFSLVVVLMLGLRADIQYADAKVGTVREKHTAEFRDMEQSIKKEIDTLEFNMNKAFYSIGKDLGRNEASHIEIAAKLDNIDKKLDEITIWMREHK